MDKAKFSFAWWLLLASFAACGERGVRTRCSCDSATTFRCNAVGYKRSDDSYVRKMLVLCTRKHNKWDVEFVASALDGMSWRLFDGFRLNSFTCHHCLMQAFPPALFASFGNELSSVEMVFCGIRDVETNVKTPFRLVQRLSVELHSCDIHMMHANALENFPAISVFNIFACKILNMSDFVFANNSRLTDIAIAHNDIERIPVNVFHNLTALKSVSLIGNLLETLENGTFNEIDLPKLEMVLLYGNNWICDCDLVWLKNYLHRNRKFINRGDDLVCSQPSNKSFTDVDFCQLSKSGVPSTKLLIFQLIGLVILSICVFNGHLFIRMF